MDSTDVENRLEYIDDRLARLEKTMSEIIGRVSTGIWSTGPDWMGFPESVADLIRDVNGS